MRSFQPKVKEFGNFLCSQDEKEKDVLKMNYIHTTHTYNTHIQLIHTTHIQHWMTGVEVAVGDDIMTGYRWLLVTCVTQSNPHPSIYIDPLSQGHIHTHSHTHTPPHTHQNKCTHTLTQTQIHREIRTNVLYWQTPTYTHKQTHRQTYKVGTTPLSSQQSFTFLHENPIKTNAIMKV